MGTTTKNKTCPRCGNTGFQVARGRATGDIGICLECGYGYYQEEYQATLDVVNDLREELELRPLSGLRPGLPDFQWRHPKLRNKTYVQEIQFRRLILCDYIGRNARTQGKTVASDLRTHKNLWDSFVFGRFDWGQLIELRDLPKGKLNADTLFIMTTVDRADRLRDVILTWNPASYWSTETSTSGSFLSSQTRHVADMMWVKELPEDVVVFQVQWD